MTDAPNVNKKPKFNWFKKNGKKPPKQKEYKRPSGWKSALLLTLSVCMLAAGVTLRVMSGFDNESELEKLAQAQLEKEKNNKKPRYLEIQAIDNVGDLERQVKPIRFDDVLLQQRNKDVAFQDVEYIAERKDAWTIQVMDVSKIEIIKDYLATQDKRDQFAYFRYIDENKKRRYILTFDDFNTQESAQKLLNNVQFDLPASIKPFPRAFRDYVKIVEQYHLENKVKEYRKGYHREIKLKKTRAPVYYIRNEANAGNLRVRRNPTSSKDRHVPSHREYAERSMSKTNAFREQAPEIGHVITSKPDESVVTKNMHSSEKSNTKNSKVEKIAEPKAAIEKTVPTKKANDNIANLIEEINN